MNGDGDDLVERFQASMAVDWERWHDGIGYDLALLQMATPTQLAAIENLLVSGGVRGWRDVEALAALGTARARESLRAAFGTASDEVRLAILQHAPELVSAGQRGAALVAALDTAGPFADLSSTLDEVAVFHPPEVIAVLWRGLQLREGEVAVHLAAMLFHLHGLSTEPFDWEHRDFFLRFNTQDAVEREAAIAELRRRIDRSR